MVGLFYSIIMEPMVDLGKLDRDYRRAGMREPMIRLVPYYELKYRGTLPTCPMSPECFASLKAQLLEDLSAELREKGSLKFKEGCRYYLELMGKYSYEDYLNQLEDLEQYRRKAWRRMWKRWMLLHRVANEVIPEPPTKRDPADDEDSE